MSSIHTNAAAISAVQILKHNATTLAATHNEVSSGLRIQSAADNAAYWSISTTMKSDAKSTSAALDALGLASAQLDVAYTGLTAAIEVVDAFKTKIVAAQEPGVDRTKIQKELDQLKQQAISIATSASFSGTNWLNTDIADLLFASSVMVDIPSSVSRSGNQFNVNYLHLDVADISLFNADGGGILQTDERGIGDIAGLRTRDGLYSGVINRESYAFDGPITLDPGHTITFDVTLDAGPYSPGVTHSIVIDRALIDSRLGTTDGMIGSPIAMANVLSQGLINAGLTGIAAAWQDSSGRFALSSLEATGQAGSSINVSNLFSNLPGGAAGGLENPPVSDVDNTYAFMGFTGSPFRLHREVTFSFELEVRGIAPVTITVDREMVDLALGTADGIVNPGADMAKILQIALAGTGINVTANGTTDLVIDPDVHNDAGQRSWFRITNVRDTVGDVPNFDLLSVDITSPTADMGNYLRGVEGMLKKLTNGAATVGAYQTRVRIQEEFARVLEATITKGVGRLIDADMNEASARLKAAQSQEQLAIQSLQIANSNAANVLSLFR
ncbi:flagellin [Ensifer sp. Root127]|uniref:flagellin N-terminal helical domain-containing protein n=1 Tax=Ensifer sp. Root127 TaxID=1736440 RepID=UPI00071097CA|nr:flagellin [Ensifer sp. Root127]KQW54798.1 hypothetical protein ASD03_19735 [Ensifer sp. Root127]